MVSLQSSTGSPVEGLERSALEGPGKQNQVQEMIQVCIIQGSTGKQGQSECGLRYFLQELNLMQLWEDHGKGRSRKGSWRIREGVIP